MFGDFEKEESSNLLAIQRTHCFKQLKTNPSYSKFPQLYLFKDQGA
jgi:hypothetical protein